jgi:hypothetical protein
MVTRKWKKIDKKGKESSYARVCRAEAAILRKVLRKAFSERVAFKQ